MPHVWVLNKAIFVGSNGGQRCIPAFGVVLMSTRVTSGMTCGGTCYLMKTGTNVRSQSRGNHPRVLDSLLSGFCVLSMLMYDCHVLFVHNKP